MTHIHKQNLHESCYLWKNGTKLKLCFNLGGKDSISGLCIDLWENINGLVVCPQCACLKQNKGKTIMQSSVEGSKRPSLILSFPEGKEHKDGGRFEQLTAHLLVSSVY